MPAAHDAFGLCALRAIVIVRSWSDLIIKVEWTGSRNSYREQEAAPSDPKPTSMVGMATLKGQRPIL
jgi:hypothetical protein